MRGPARLLVCVALIGCADDARSYAEALRTGACDRIGDAALADDCRAQHLQCAAITGDASECWFRQAEQAEDGALCAKAGPYADDCRMHLFTGSMKAWAPPDARPGDAEDEVSRRAVTAGFAADDPRPWSAWYRYVLERGRPFDRPACLRVTDPARREACLRTALVAWDDRLNRARDRGLYPCDGRPMPPILEHTPDAELDARTAARADLCRR